LGKPGGWSVCRTRSVATPRFTSSHRRPRSSPCLRPGESEPRFVPQNDRQVINLEHFLPKKPEGNWPQFNEEEVRQLATRFGNLALLRASDNSDLKSESFKDKKQTYAKSPTRAKCTMNVIVIANAGERAS
jgi:hypothetical protein